MERAHGMMEIIWVLRRRSCEKGLDRSDVSEIKEQCRWTEQKDEMIIFRDYSKNCREFSRFLWLLQILFASIAQNDKKMQQGA